MNLPSEQMVSQTTPPLPLGLILFAGNAFLTMQSLSSLTPPVPLSCMWLKPVIGPPPVVEKPPCPSFTESGTAFAMPNGSVAPAKT